MKTCSAVVSLAKFAFLVLILAMPVREAIAQTSADYFTWGVSANSSVLYNDQGGSIELGQPYGGSGSNPVEGGVPYIDFHFGNGLSQDFNYRIQNSGNNVLSFNSTTTNTLNLEQNSIQVNGGVDATGNGIKHVRTDASCETGDVPGDTCTIDIIWPGLPFADTNYTVTCTPKAITVVASPVILVIPDANKTTTGVSVVVENLTETRSVVGVGGLNCIAIHD